MSKDSKFLTRPKVRFSQNPEEEEKAEGSKASGNQAPGRQSGPKIRSVVVLEKPVTLVRESKPPVYFRYKQQANVHSTEGQGQEEDEIECLTERFAKIPKNLVQPSASPQTRLSETDQIPKNSTKNTRDVDMIDTNNHAPIVIESDDSSAIEEVPIVPPLDLPISEDEKQIKKPKPKATKHTNISKHPRGKENSKSLANTTKPVKLPKRKAPTVTLMPCHKYMMSSKTKSSSVTKKVLHNITGAKTNPCVSRGVLKSIDKSNPIPRKEKKLTLKENDFSTRLLRPEYNSIMCTVTKLQEVREEKIVTDIDNLPSTYKALINAKASTALDFPMNSAIYKNLVDLSVDEQQLPSRLTRSKDPEPREKDITPVLSDFFAPETTEEYCIPASVKPCIPDVIDNWSAYKISNKIVHWKASMDLVQ